MKNLFKELYESEINLQFGWFWDAGFDVKIGNEMSGYIAEFNSYDLNECEKWIEEKVKELYPNSKFAKTYKGDTFESATEPAIRFLFKNWHPHTKIYIDYSSAELLTGEQCHNLNNEIPDQISVGKKLNKKDLLNSNLATKKGYCTQRLGIRPVADFEALNYQIMTNLNTSTEATITDETAIGFIPCYNQPFINVISLGAGKQSSYMLLTALEGAFKFKPDLAIFSDTGCEPDYVYSYVTWLKDYVKNKYNFDIVIVSAGNIVDDTLNYLNGKKSRVAALPLRLSGNGGLIMRQCTNDYKIAPLRKYVQTIRNGNKVRLWIGISLDEIERIKDSTVKYIENYYPLIENRISIDQIINWFRENEMREPGKSACLICPFHSDNYWKVFKKQYPNEFEKACKFDDAIRNYPNLKRQTFLSKHLKPLREIDFTQHPSLFPELIEECNGLCGL